MQQVRRFNRLVIQRTGALETSYLRRGRPLGEARLLFEIGPDGADVRTLRTRLDLNSGYLSRLLRSLESQHLITVRPEPDDARRRAVTLTRKGRAEYTAYEKLSDGLATSWLEPLTPTQRDRLTIAMAEVERLITAATIAVRIEPPDSDAARHCLAQYFAELATRFETGFDPARSNSATEAEMTPPAGYFFIAWIDTRPAGCGALKCNPRRIGEVKRMWTAPDARGLGVARRILHAIETKARDLRLKRLRLETNRTLLEAQSLYRSAGYREVAAFNAEPYAHHWFEKRL
ncbi:MAG TPA: bifunctional helix-turn-helix transcriptional regulator/GNAT family N-acetyltransferase [Acetobacteraceae bacterium]|nr:bifunctional helix-turn-helix transcriptional regulator/GNAT family N-acetyltransferase [Acetobacteraceae bacterium]